MRQRYTQAIRAIVITISLLLLVALLIGFVWGWVIALVFVIGGAFFALCCFLSYYCRVSFSFNNIPDTNMSSMVAFLTHSIPKPAMPPRPSSEVNTFKPFIFKQDKERELEDMKVRALLRQVFPDEEAV